MLLSATIDDDGVSSPLLRVLRHRNISACGGVLPGLFRRHSLLSEELKLAVLQVRVVKTRQDVADAQALRNTLRLLVLLLVERDVVVLRDVLQRLEKVTFEMPLSLFLLDDEHSLEVQIVFLL